MVVVILLRLLDAKIFNEISTIRHLTFTLLRHLLFRWISRHPVVVERWNYHHSTRLDETVLMSCVISFYDHWMSRYSMKQWKMGFLLVKWVFYVSFTFNNLSFTNVDFYLIYYLIKWSSIRWFSDTTESFWVTEIMKII